MYSTKKIRLLIIKVWEPLLVLIAGLVLVGGVLLYRLGSLLPGLSVSETLQLKASQTLSLISSNPLNAPAKVMDFCLSVLHQQGPWAVRAVSALFGLVSIGLFYYIVSHWHTKLVALLGTALFATSSWFLHYARLATPDILLVLLIAVPAYGIWIHGTRRSVLAIVLGVVLAVTLMYVPGLVWIVLIGGLWQSKTIARHIKQAGIISLPLIIAGLIIIVPLAIALAQQPSLVRSFLGAPQVFATPAYELFRQILNVPVQIFIKGPSNPVVWLGRLPLLDLFCAVMCLLGIYASFLKHRLDRTRLLVGWLILGTLLVGLHGPVTIPILLPPIYLFITAGLDYMLGQWFSVFPLNPLARSIGITLIVAATLLSGYYNLRHYFVAWPNAPATKQVFNQRS